MEKKDRKEKSLFGPKIFPDNRHRTLPVPILRRIFVLRRTDYVVML